MRGRELMGGVGKTMMQSGGTFGTFMAIGMGIRCWGGRGTTTSTKQLHSYGTLPVNTATALCLLNVVTLSTDSLVLSIKVHICQMVFRVDVTLWEAWFCQLFRFVFGFGHVQSFFFSISRLVLERMDRQKRIQTTFGGGLIQIYTDMSECWCSNWISKCLLIGLTKSNPERRKCICSWAQLLAKQHGRQCSLLCDFTAWLFGGRDDTSTFLNASVLESRA